MSETINGLLTQKATSPEPIAGQVKSFSWENRTGKSGNPYIKIKNETAEYGGRDCRIINAQKTDFVGAHGNLSWNLEIEPVNGTPKHQDAHRMRPEDDDAAYPPQEIEPQWRARQQGASSEPQIDGVAETRRHIMQSANLYVLCINAVEKYCAAHFPEVAQTSDQFQAATSTLFIEASGRRTNDGVNWWSYVDKMPVKPIGRVE